MHSMHLLRRSVNCHVKPRNLIETRTNTANGRNATKSFGSLPKKSLMMNHTPVSNLPLLKLKPITFSPQHTSPLNVAFTNQPGCQNRRNHMQIPFVSEEIALEEIDVVIKRSKATSTPSPLDQISYSVFKNCPALRHALHTLYNKCWLTTTTPQQWKQGALKLLGKKTAENDPSSPTNFRPIALTSFVGKLFTSILKNRWMDYMVSNKYLNTSIQKAFVDGVPGCTKHHVKLLAAIDEARKKHKSLTVCWLDLANAYGSVHHNLIQFSLEHYHAPTKFCNVIQDLYTDLCGFVMTSEWTTDMFNMDIGVFQGDPLSVLIFNTVMNTYVDTITINHRDTGYCFSKSNHRVNLLQYADDTCLIGDGPASCQALLTKTEQWLEWARMKAKVPKCASLAFQASTGRGYDPSLRLQGDTIPFIGNSTFRFLGAPITIHDAKVDHRGTLLSKLESMLKKVDDTLLTRQQKLHLYSHGICPRMVWDMVISNLSITWVVKNLEATATRFLKRWSGLARSAANHRLYLPKTNGGLHLPSLSSIFKKTRCGLAASQMCSQDSTVRLIASRQTVAEDNSTRAAFKPHQEVVKVMREDPGASRSQLIKRVISKESQPLMTAGV